MPIDTRMEGEVGMQIQSDHNEEQNAVFTAIWMRGGLRLGEFSQTQRMASKQHRFSHTQALDSQPEECNSTFQGVERV